VAEDNRERLKQWLASGEIRLQPLTFPQRELWEASPVPPDHPSNNICAMIHIRGPITPAGSEAAMQRVVDRQEVFRLSFLPGKAGPLQMIRRSGKPQMIFRDLPASQQSPEAIDEAAEEIFRRPFDMVKGPLYRAEVLRRAADDHTLVLAIHHSIADGWTLGVFVQDLFTAYLGAVRGDGGPLPTVPLSYSAWGAAERAYWQPVELEKRAGFWRSNLAGTRRLWRAPSASGALHRCISTIPADLGKAVRELARRQGATLYSTLLAAFQITMAEWSGENDLVVGTPVANRNKQAVRETMGYCSGIIPVRGRIDPSRKFSKILQETHRSTLDAFANAMPFVELTRAIGDTAAPGHNPVFDVRFALQNHPVPDISMAGLSLQLRMRSTGTARFHLACEITERGDELDIEWLFREDLMALDDVRNLSQMYSATLARVCDSPEMPACAQLSQLS
jgi:hypothetical protein